MARARCARRLDPLEEEASDLTVFAASYSGLLERVDILRKWAGPWNDRTRHEVISDTREPQQADMTRSA
ncbi:MAG: hypothetical protein V3S30_01840 [Thermoanaerobaculia bacterium]